MQIQLSRLVMRLPSGPLLFELAPKTIEKGAKLLIQGPSGSGKSTLLHLIAGLLMPTEGSVLVDDRDLRFLSDDERTLFRRQNFGIVFQSLNLLNHLTAAENVALGLSPAQASAENITRALASLGMEPAFNKRVTRMSVGEKQRIAAARVVAARPKVVLADEPTSALDDGNAEKVIDALLRLPHRPTVIVVSHDRRLGERFDEIWHFSHRQGTA